MNLLLKVLGALFLLSKVWQFAAALLFTLFLVVCIALSGCGGTQRVESYPVKGINHPCQNREIELNKACTPKEWKELE